MLLTPPPCSEVCAGRALAGRRCGGVDGGQVQQEERFPGTWRPSRKSPSWGTGKKHLLLCLTIMALTSGTPDLRAEPALAFALFFGAWQIQKLLLMFQAGPFMFSSSQRSWATSLRRFLVLGVHVSPSGLLWERSSRSQLRAVLMFLLWGRTFSREAGLAPRRKTSAQTSEDTSAVLGAGSQQPIPLQIPSGGKSHSSGRQGSGPQAGCRCC